MKFARAGARPRPQWWLIATIAAIAAALSGALLSGPLAPSAGAQAPTQFRVTVTNLTDPEMIITPGAWLVHSQPGEFWTMGEAANLGLERIAEIGVPDEAVASLGATAIGDPIPANGDTITFTIEAVPGYLFSFAQMLIATNDGFVGADSVPLFDGATPIGTSMDLFAYDAGTEENADLFAGFDAGQPDPAQGMANVENGTPTDEPIGAHDQFDVRQGTLTVEPLTVLPATGSGGLAADGGSGTPAWVWAAVAAAGVAAGALGLCTLRGRI